MGLDEVTQICPVPLPSWLSDSGGKGIQVIAVVHGEAQLAERWGDHGRQVVLDTSSVKVFLPGITDVTTLQAASTLCGQASWKVRGQDHATRHDVATPDMIRQLPAGFALVIRGGCAPVIARLPRAWRNPAYRRARRLGQAPWTAAPSLPAAEAAPVRLPDHVPAEWIPGDGTCLPLELTMTATTRSPPSLDQLAAHAEQLTRLDARQAEHHAAVTALAELTDQAAARPRRRSTLPRSPSSPRPARPARTPTVTSPGPRRRGGSSPPPTGRNRSPGCGPGSSRSTGPATGTWPPPSAPAGPPTTCACTAWTSQPSCGRCCTCSPPAPRALLSAQAEYQARILPALADQLRTETNRCGHPRNPAQASGQPWSTP